MDEIDNDGEVEEDNIPEDWKPDFIPKHENANATLVMQPDVVPTNSRDFVFTEESDKSDVDALDALTRYRSSKRYLFSQNKYFLMINFIKNIKCARRYLQKQMGDMRRHSLASETFQEEDESDELEDFN